jgi:hypothetical protein
LLGRTAMLRTYSPSSLTTTDTVPTMIPSFTATQVGPSRNRALISSEFGVVAANASGV